ncbi:hypothetical protein VTH82DRAFT_1144 [Thermothelomyces myriococcoides]
MLSSDTSLSSPPPNLGLHFSTFSTPTRASQSQGTVPNTDDGFTSSRQQFERHTSTPGSPHHPGHQQQQQQQQQHGLSASRPSLSPLQPPPTAFFPQSATSGLQKQNSLADEEDTR